MEITVKSQKELDTLPVETKTCKIDFKGAVLNNSNYNSKVTYILINSSSATLFNSSSAILYDSSSAQLHHSSTATLWGSSSARLFQFSNSFVYGEYVKLKLYDKSSAKFRCEIKNQIEHKTTQPLLLKTIQNQASRLGLVVEL